MIEFGVVAVHNIFNGVRCTINQIYQNKCMSYLLSSAISLFVRSDKVFAGSTFRSCLTCTAFRDSLTPFLEFWEISLSLLSSNATRLSMETSKTNRMTKQQIMHTIAPKCTKERNPFVSKLRFAGFCSLFNSCFIWAKWIQTLTLVNSAKIYDKMCIRRQWCFVCAMNGPAVMIREHYVLNITCRTAFISRVIEKLL